MISEELRLAKAENRLQMNEMEDETGQQVASLQAARTMQITEVDGMRVETHSPSKKVSAANTSAQGNQKSQISGQDSTSDDAGSPESNSRRQKQTTD